jgi:glucosamine 6-phosphate synthetase-like amidotransferase/phosphosugar isomerase protein
MLTNILEQPIVAQKCLDMDLLLPSHDIHHMTIAACGSSRHTGLVAKYWFEHFSQIPTQVLDAADWETPRLPPGSLMYALSQSGQTIDVLSAIAQAHPAQIWGITNGFDTPLHQACHYTLQTPAGEEKAVAATKTLLAQMILLLRVAIALGKSAESELQQLPQLIQQTIALSQPIAQTIAPKIAAHQNLMLLGRGIDYPIALEGALKLKETAYIHAEGMAAGDFMHGPIAIVEPGFPVIMIAIPDSPNYAALVANAKRIKSYGAGLVGITTTDSPDRDLFDIVLPVASIAPILSPLLSVIPLQFLAYYVALEKGVNVDAPRNLTKFIGQID